MAAFLIPRGADAAAWRTYSSKALGFSFHYPSSWLITSTGTPAMKAVTVFSRDATYSLEVDTFNLKPGKTAAVTLARYLAYVRTSQGTAIAHLHWHAVTFAKHAARGAISYPSTEGGVGIANGIYVVGFRHHIYRVTLLARGKKLPSQLSAFPRLYRQVVASWKFL